MDNHFRRRVAVISVAAVLAGDQSALAHPGHLPTHGNPWTGGLLHPLLGWDHLLAAVLVGLLAVRIRSPGGLWLVPVVYVGLMTSGAALAAMGVALPLATLGVALSAIVLGLIVALASRLHPSAAAVLVGLFAVSHGHAHVAANSSAMLPYLGGLLVTTAALLAAAIGVGLLALRIKQPQLVRFAGGGIAAICGLMLLIG